MTRRDPRPAQNRVPGHPPRSRSAVLLSLLLLSCQERSAAIRDDTGNPIRATPRRVVSLAPNLTQMIAAAGALDRIVGTDNFSNEPPSVKALPKVGDMQPNAELIGQLRPDLVLTVASTTHPALGRSLETLGIPLFVARVDRLDDVPRVIRTLGRIFDTSSVAERNAKNFENEIDALRRSRAQRPRVLFALFLDPLYVAGRNTFIDDLLHLTGASNAVATDGWPQYSLEAVAADPPDIIIVASKTRTREQLERFFRETPPWSDLPVVKRGFWYVVEEDRFARAGPVIPVAAAELAEILDQWEQKQ